MKYKKYFFIIFSAVSFISALIFYYGARTYLANSAEAEAVIIRDKNANEKSLASNKTGNEVCNTDNDSYIIQFITAEGRNINTSISISSSRILNEGDRISILYDKNNPETASVRHSWKIVYFSRAILLFCLSILFDIAAFRIK